MTDQGQGLILIAGQRKSGSTWLLNLLCLHPAIRGLDETHLFNLLGQEPTNPSRATRLFTRTPFGQGGSRHLVAYRLLRFARRLQRGANDSKLSLRDRPLRLLDLPLRRQRALWRSLADGRDRQDFCRRFFAFFRRELGGPRYLLEKSPSHVFHLAAVRAVFPAAKVLVIHRDGRDVVVSDRFFAKAFEHREVAFADSVLSWRRQIEAELAHSRDPAVLTCSYEELHASGAEVVRGILRFLELPADDHLVQEMLDRASFRYRSGRQPGDERRNRFLRKGIVGDWRNHFTPEHSETFRRLAGDLLIALGYEKDLTWQGVPSLAATEGHR